MSTVAFSQAINEGFDDVTTLPGSGWAQQNLSTTQGTNPTWGQGGTPFPANSGAATAYVAANYNAVTGSGTISNWLFAPNRTFDNGDVISFYARAADAGYPDRLQVRFSSNGASVNAGTTDASVGDFTTLLIDINPTLIGGVFTNAWVQYSYTFTGLGAPTSGRVAFRYFVTNGGPSGANSDYIGVDDFVYTPAGSPTAPDVAVSLPNSGQYTMTPISQVTAIPLSARITNAGTDVATDATLTVNVYQLPSTLVQTTSSTPANLAIGANTVATAGTFTPTMVGDYYIEYISSATGDVNMTNDTTSNIVQIDDSTYARDYANVTGVTGLAGIGTGQGGQLGNMFNLTVSDTITAIHAFISNQNGQLQGQSFVCNLYSWSGTASSLLGTTVSVVLDSAINKNTLHELALSSGPIVLAPGMYVVSAQEIDSNISCGYTSTVYTTNGSLVNATGFTTDFTDVAGAFGGTQIVPVVRAVFGTPDITIGINKNVVSSFEIYPNPAVNSINVKNAVVGSTIEIFNNLGQLVSTDVVRSNNLNVDVTKFDNGVYTIKNTSNDNVITQSFVKQ
jgi:hypothetical protein